MKAKLDGECSVCRGGRGWGRGGALQLLPVFIWATLLCVYTNVSSHECHTHTPDAGGTTFLCFALVASCC